MIFFASLIIVIPSSVQLAMEAAKLQMASCAPVWGAHFVLATLSYEAMD